MKVFGGNGLSYTLASTYFKKGGEGELYEVVGNKDMVAKIYISSSGKDEETMRRVKVEAMVAGNKPADSNIAWPLVVLYDSPSNGKFVGFLMRKIPSGKSLNDLCAYPHAKHVSMHDKIRVARSIVDVARSVHEAEHIIGDFNDKNIIVLKDCKVALVDCDSFDIWHAGQHHPCISVMPSYNAPEVLRAIRHDTYRSCAERGIRVFSEESDAWALAVHIFRILFNGCHPYFCKALPNKDGSFPAAVPEDQRVARGETPFFKKVSGLTVPDFTPELSAFPDYMTILFKRAFFDSHTDASLRPSVDDWADALQRYESELVQCKQQPAHFYSRQTKACPYCAAEQRLTRVQNQTASGKTGATAHAAHGQQGVVANLKGKVKTAGVAVANAGGNGSAKSHGNGAAAQAPIALPQAAGKHLGTVWAWILSLGIAIAIAALVSSLPITSQAFYTLLDSSDPVEMGIVVLVGAVVATVVFRLIYGRDTKKGVRLSGLCAAGGAVVAIPVAALLLFVVEAVVSFLLLALIIGVIFGVLFN